jgi:uncharacterized protein YndB with AHSA1/START domain
MTTTTDDAVRRSVDVRAPLEVAWAVFTEQMGSWWPLATHSIAAERDATPDGVVVEGRVGGAIYETLDDDRCTWGTVVEWAPPHRLAVDWVVGNDVTTRWTATFTATPGGTRLDLVHTGFAAHGEREAVVRDAYGHEEGWSLVLGRFADAADAADDTARA